MNPRQLFSSNINLRNLFPSNMDPRKLFPFNMNPRKLFASKRSLIITSVSAILVILLIVGIVVFSLGRKKAPDADMLTQKSSITNNTESSTSATIKPKVFNSEDMSSISAHEALAGKSRIKGMPIITGVLIGLTLMGLFILHTLFGFSGIFKLPSVFGLSSGISAAPRNSILSFVYVIFGTIFRIIKHPFFVTISILLILVIYFFWDNIKGN